MKQWEVLRDCHIRLIWACDNPDCDNYKMLINTNPIDVMNIGTPICNECDDDLVYIETAVWVGETDV